jgi:aryl-alcohol dehydrogenase-like predicted oxidoreductase
MEHRALGRSGLPQNWALLEKVNQIAARRGTTAAAMSLAWLLPKPEVSTVIVGARTVKQLDENLAAVEVKLAPDEVAELDQVSAPTWGHPYSFIGTREPW